MAFAPVASPAPQASSAASATTSTVSLASARGRTLLAGITAAHFSHHVSNSLLNPLLPFIRDSLALSYPASGLLVTAFSFSLGFSNAPIGYLADRVGVRPVIVWGLVLTGIISALIAGAPGYWQLFALLVALGIVAGTYHAPAASLIARTYPPEARGTAMGLHITGGHLAFFIVPLVAALMVNATGTWRTPYLWLAFAPVVCGFVVWRLTPGGHAPPTAGADRWAVFREVGSVLKTIGPLASISILMQVFNAALMAFTTLYLVDARGLAPELAAVYFGVPQLIGTLAAPLGGLLSDRVGRRAVILAGIVLLGPSFLSLLLVPTELILLPLSAIGIAAALRLTVTEVYVVDSAPAHRRATVMGSYYLLVQQTGGVAAPMLGILAGAVGITAGYGGISLAMAAVSVIVLLVQRWLR
jgi:FSR family fosmidomycin resistance protein-like MFS transporter